VWKRISRLAKHIQRIGRIFVVTLLFFTGQNIRVDIVQSFFFALFQRKKISVYLVDGACMDY